MERWEPHSSRKPNCRLSSSPACPRQVARAVSSCSLALRVFFFASSPSSGSPGLYLPGSPGSPVRLPTVGSALPTSHRHGLAIVATEPAAEPLLFWQDDQEWPWAAPDRSLVFV